MYTQTVLVLQRSQQSFSYEDSKHHKHGKVREWRWKEADCTSTALQATDSTRGDKQKESGRGGGRETDRPIVAATCCISCVYPSGMHIVVLDGSVLYMYCTHDIEYSNTDYSTYSVHTFCPPSLILGCLLACSLLFWSSPRLHGSIPPCITHYPITVQC